MEERSPESPVVEDNAELASLIIESLPSTYQIYKAANGAEGLELAVSLVPDLR